MREHPRSADLQFRACQLLTGLTGGVTGGDAEKMSRARDASAFEAVVLAM
jgi:hypothetical protein